MSRLSKSKTSDFPFFGILECFNDGLIDVIELVESVFEKNESLFINDVKDPILKPVGKFPDFSHAFGLNIIQVLCQQDYDRVVVTSLNKNVIHLNVVIVVYECGVSQLIVDW
jgi:hypothetical protein